MLDVGCSARRRRLRFGYRPSRSLCPHRPRPTLLLAMSPATIFHPTAFNRRSFLRSTAALAALATVRPAHSLLAKSTPPPSESAVKLLFDSLQPAQKAQIWFPWDHVDSKRGLLRTRIQNN